jgi:hypothetical protein
MIPFGEAPFFAQLRNLVSPGLPERRRNELHFSAEVRRFFKSFDQKQLQKLNR